MQVEDEDDDADDDAGEDSDSEAKLEESTDGAETHEEEKHVGFSFLFVLTVSVLFFLRVNCLLILSFLVRLLVCRMNCRGENLRFLR